MLICVGLSNPVKSQKKTGEANAVVSTITILQGQKDHFILYIPSSHSNRYTVALQTLERNTHSRLAIILYNEFCNLFGPQPSSTPSGSSSSTFQPMLSWCHSTNLPLRLRSASFLSQYESYKKHVYYKNMPPIQCNDR
jgi:hypothetical protein